MKISVLKISVLGGVPVVCLTVLGSVFLLIGELSPTDALVFLVLSTLISWFLYKSIGYLGFN